MPQQTILPAGSTAATSSDVVVAAGGSVTLGIFSSGAIPSGAAFRVFVKTPGADMEIAHLSKSRPVLSLLGPATYRVRRATLSGGASVGVFSET